MNHLMIAALLCLALAIVLGAIDGSYYHLQKYRLYANAESRFEHQLHTIRAFLFAPIIWLLFGSKIASVYVQPHIGGDIAFLEGVAKHVLELGAADRDFIGRHTTGWEAVEADLQTARWEDLERASGVARATMEDVARRYARARAAVFMWAMGITHHENGTENVEAIC